MEKQFTFSFLESGFKLDTEKTELLMKWGLDRSLNCHKWTFDQQFQQYEANNFLNCLFRDSSVANALGYAGLEIGKVDFEPVTTNYTTLDLFNCLKEGSFAPVRPDGTINGCFPDKFRDVNCETELHMALLNEDSDQYCVFSDEDRKEFLFLIFQILVLGGSLCQYENNLQPYLDLTRMLYKNLVSVYKNKSDNKLVVSSFVYAIKAVNDVDGNPVFPAASFKDEHVQTVCFAVVDPSSKHVKLLTNKWTSFW